MNDIEKGLRESYKFQVDACRELIKNQKPITFLKIDRSEDVPKEKLFDTIDMLWEARERLHRDLATLRDENERLGNREGKAHLELSIDAYGNPFHRIDLKTADFGVADNIYVVTSDDIQKIFDENARLREAIGKAEGLVGAIANSRKGSIGSLESHYIVQIEVSRVSEVTQAITAALDSPGKKE